MNSKGKLHHSGWQKVSVISEAVYALELWTFIMNIYAAKNQYMYINVC